ncbi:MAG: hypothetical protein IKX71_00415 [Bacteroidales bacterium]|nr:hypothetical protein [Bacteroidales bacterium]
MQIKEYLLHYTWDLAYGRFDSSVADEGVSYNHLTIVKNPYKNKWFADPFILREDNNDLHLLVEEFDFGVGRGRIAHIVIDKSTNKITCCKIILEAATHLSFPAIYEIEGKLYVHPENAASSKSIIYEYNQEQEALVNPMVLIDEPLTDAIIHRAGDLYEVVSTKNPTPNGNMLYFYRSESFFGPYTLADKVAYPSNKARMAGAFLGDVRPAQNCNGAYGRSVVFYKNNKEIKELKPSGVKYAGLHTFNTLNNTFVVDLKKYDFALLYYIKERLKGRR